MFKLYAAPNLIPLKCKGDSFCRADNGKNIFSVLVGMCEEVVNSLRVDDAS